MKNWNWKMWMVGLTALVATGCADSKDDKIQNAPVLERIEAGLQLEKAESCEDLEGYLKNLLREQLKNSMMSMHSPGALVGGVEPNLVLASPEMDMAATGGEGGGEFESGGSVGESKSIDIAENYTGTNNQEVAVDEADIVKTDGEFIYILRDNSLLITTAWPADDIEVIASKNIEGHPTQMFIQDDTIAVFSDVWDTWAIDEKLGTRFEEQDIWELTKVTMLDISDRAEPKVVREAYADGRFQSARLVGQTARVILSSSLHINLMEEHTYGGMEEPVFVDAPIALAAEEPREAEEVSGETASGDFEAGKADMMIVLDDEEQTTIYADSFEEAQALLEIQKYEEKINKLGLDDMLPTVAEVIHHEDGSTTVEQAYLAACENHYKPSVEAGLNLLSVMTIDMGAPAEARTTTSIIGEAGQVYASANAIYIASNLFTGWLSTLPEVLDDYEITAIHKFDIASSGDEALYAGTGTIKGYVLNQFSLSEFEGNLRVAHTRSNWFTGETESDNRITVLAEGEGNQLDTIGELKGLAPGEQIYSARFMGEKGYIVTFETIDPLFTIDLSEPTAPKVVGELKIPGFSTYIHPMGDDHLLTIGEHTEINEWGGVSTVGIQLSIFDVSDFANPKQAHKIVLDESTWSSAVYDAKAFTFHAESGILALPINSWDESFNEEGEYTYSQTVGLSLFNVDAADGFSEHGFINHAPFLDDNGYGWEEVRRSMIMGEHIYSIGNLGMMVTAAENLEEKSAIAFPSEAEFMEEGFGGDTFEDEAMAVEFEEDTMEIPPAGDMN